MSWLLRDGDVLAAIEDRRKGWHQSLQGALVIRGPFLVHTLVSAAALDLARCGLTTLDGDTTGFKVERIVAVSPRRLTAPLLGRGAVVVAPAGSFERWKLRVGDCLEIRGG
jgi:hypothetical protein